MQVDEKFRIGTLIDKANESLGAAEELLEEDCCDEAILRCYHAVFFTLRAFLKKNNVTVTMTSESSDAFKKIFIDTGKLPAERYAEWMAVMEASGFERSGNRVSSNAESARQIFDKADRFCTELMELI